MQFKIFFALMGSLASVGAVSIQRQTAAPVSIPDPGFELPNIHDYWHWGTLGAKVELVNYPVNSTNHALHISGLASDEQYAIVNGHLINAVALTNYSTSFVFQYVNNASYVSWDVSIQVPNSFCHPSCYVYEASRQKYPKKVIGGVWYTWSGVLSTPKRTTQTKGKMLLTVSPLTYGYGPVYIDNFTIAALP